MASSMLPHPERSPFILNLVSGLDGAPICRRWALRRIGYFTRTAGLDSRLLASREKRHEDREEEVTGYIEHDEEGEEVEPRSGDSAS